MNEPGVTPEATSENICALIQIHIGLVNLNSQVFGSGDTETSPEDIITATTLWHATHQKVTYMYLFCPEPPTIVQCIRDIQYEMTKLQHRTLALERTAMECLVEAFTSGDVDKVLKEHPFMPTAKNPHMKKILEEGVSTQCCDFILDHWKTSVEREKLNLLMVVKTATEKNNYDLVEKLIHRFKHLTHYYGMETTSAFAATNDSRYIDLIDMDNYDYRCCAIKKLLAIGEWRTARTLTDRYSDEYNAQIHSQLIELVSFAIITNHDANEYAITYGIRAEETTLVRVRIMNTAICLGLLTRTICVAWGNHFMVNPDPTSAHLLTALKATNSIDYFKNDAIPFEGIYLDAFYKTVSNWVRFYNGHALPRSLKPAMRNQITSVWGKWTPQFHFGYPKGIRDAVHTLLLIRNRTTPTLPSLPYELYLFVCGMFLNRQ
jgi:hypothetical protein